MLFLVILSISFEQPHDLPWQSLTQDPREPYVTDQADQKDRISNLFPRTWSAKEVQNRVENLSCENGRFFARR